MATAMNDEQVTTDKLLQDLQTVVHDAEALLRATSGQTSEKIREVRAKAEESLRAARARLTAAEADAMRQARELVVEGEEYVRRNPLQAVGVAAGIGLLLGLLLARR